MSETRSKTTRAAAPGGVAADPDDNSRKGPWTQAMTGPARHHGLDIIRAVADAWGSDSDHATRTVWARFDWPGQPQPDPRLGQGASGHTRTRHHR